ncbi:MAG: tetratricopeptide repeat protein [Methylococcaceae bacterium]|nr:MAG: tetratricopeptide repeat protein [Methylococcaceae bacterium]
MKSHRALASRLARLPWRRLAPYAVTALLLLTFTSWTWHQYAQRQEAVRTHLNAAEAAMNSGDYAQAATHSAQVLQVEAGHPAAQLNAQIAALAQRMGQGLDTKAVADELAQLRQLAPDNAYLRVLQGNWHYQRDEWDQAGQLYDAAIEKNPQLAEAYFNRGMLNLASHDPQLVEADFRDALRLAPNTPQYRNNLAYFYLEQGDYARAIETYGAIEDQPLPALEAAKAHWGLGQLAEARTRQEQALAWLDDPRIADLPHNQTPWIFALSANEGVRLSDPQDKHCYAGLSLAATLYLQGDTAGTGRQVQNAHCPKAAADMQDVVAEDLLRYAEYRPELADAGVEFRRRYLTGK